MLGGTWVLNLVILIDGSIVIIEFFNLPNGTKLVNVGNRVWLVSTRRFTWEEVFHTKPKECRNTLQEEVTEARYEWSESIWLNVFKTWVRAMQEIVCVPFEGIAVTDLRFLIEMRGIKKRAVESHTSRPPTSRPPSR